MTDGKINSSALINRVGKTPEHIDYDTWYMIHTAVCIAFKTVAFACTQPVMLHHLDGALIYGFGRGASDAST